MPSLGDLVVTVGANIEGFSTAMGSVSDTLFKLNRDTEDSFKGFDRLGTQISGFGTTLSAAITLPLLAAGGAAVNFAGEFDSQMRKVTSLIADVTDKDFKNLSADVLELSRSMGVDAVKAADALYQAISSGVPKDNAVDFLRVATTAAIAGVTDTRVAVDGLTTVLQAFNLNASETKKVADAMFTAVNIGKLEFPELVASIGIAAGTAHALGISYSELLAAGATLTNTTGQKIPEAMTMLEAAMKAVIKPTTAMEEELNKMGFSSGEALIKAKGLEGGLKAIADSAGGNVTVLASLFQRVEGLRGTLGLTGDNAARAAEDLDKFSHASDGIGAASAAAAEINKGFARQLEMFTTELKDVGIQLGTTLLPVVEQAFQSMKPFIGLIEEGAVKFAALSEPMRNSILGFTALAAATGPALFIVGQMISTFGQLATAIDLVNTALTSKGLLAAFTATGASIAAIVAAAGAAGVGIAYLGNKASEAALAQQNANATWLKGIDSAAGLSHAVTDVGGAFDSSKDAVLTFVKNLDAHAAATKTAGDSVADLAAKHLELEKDLKRAETGLGDVKKAFEMGAASSDDLQEAQQKVYDIMRKLHPEWELTRKYSDDLMQSTSAAAAGFEELGTKAFDSQFKVKSWTEILGITFAQLQMFAGLYPHTIDLMQKWADELTDSNPALNTNAVNMKALDGIIRTSQGSFADQTKAIIQLTQASGVWRDEAILGIQDVGKLKERLDLATDAYNNLAKDGIKNATTELQGQIAKQQIAIQLAVQQGDDTTQLRIDLDGMTDALHRQAMGYSEVASQLKQVQLSGLQTAFHDLLFDIGDVADAFKKMGEGMVDVVVNRIIADAMTPLLKSLDSVIANATRALASVLGISVPGGGGSISTAIGNGGPIVAFPGTEGAAGAASSAGSQAGSVGSAISSSIAPMISAITGVVSAVTGVVSVFQNMHQETSLNAIEANTRITAILLGAPNASGSGPQDATSLKYMLGEVRNLLTSVPDILGTLNDLRGNLLGGLIDYPKGLTDLVVPRLDLIAANTAKSQALPPVTVQIAGNVIGNTEFVDQIATVIASKLRLQGVSA